MPHQKVKDCLEILGQKLDEYIQTHKEWYKKGYLCPHEGSPKAHMKMDEIIQDVEQAHDMLHAALGLAKYHDDPHHDMDHVPMPAAGRKM